MDYGPQEIKKKYQDGKSSSSEDIHIQSNSSVFSFQHYPVTYSSNPPYHGMGINMVGHQYIRKASIGSRSHETEDNEKKTLNK